MNYCYLRVSSDIQSVEAQKFGVMEYCKRASLPIDRWLEEKVSGAREIKSRRLGGLLPNLKKGDNLVVAELSRLGRSVSMVVTAIEGLLKRGITVHLVKQGMVLGKEEDTDPMKSMMSKMFLCVSALFAEMERGFIKARVGEGIKRKIESGFDWGSRTRGKRYRTKVTENAGKVLSLRQSGKSVAQIIKKTGLGRSSVYRILEGKRVV